MEAGGKLGDVPDSAADRGSEFDESQVKREKRAIFWLLAVMNSFVTLKKALRRQSHFSGECENQGSPGSPLPGGTIGPAGGDSHGPCTPEPPPGPQMPGRPATAAPRRHND